jgi:hypothetical protein
MKQAAVVTRDFDKASFALALARNQVGEKLPIDQILIAENVDPKTADQFLDDPLFIKDVQRLAKELTENGFGFEAKCRILAEDTLRTMYQIIKDEDAPAATRMKGIENLVEWGKLKPKTTDAANAGPGFTIQIVIPQAVQSAAIAEGVADAMRIPVTIDQTEENNEEPMDPASGGVDLIDDAYEDELQN